MRVTVRLFAGLRERAGRARVELDDVQRVGDVWPALGLGDEPAGLLYALNREYAEPSVELHDGDEVALIPPVSGGATIRTDRIDVSEVIEEVGTPEDGAIAVFVGTVRRESRGKEVLYLEYEAFEEMAHPMMQRLESELRREHALSAIAIHHRVGRVEVAEPSVVIAVSARHRAAALDACRQAIDTLKETIPLWKKEVYSDGEEWVGRGS